MEMYDRITELFVLVRPDITETGKEDFRQYWQLCRDVLPEVERDIYSISDIFFSDIFTNRLFLLKYYKPCEIEFVSPAEMETVAPEEPDGLGGLEKIRGQVRRGDRLAARPLSRADEAVVRELASIWNALERFGGDPEKSRELASALKELAGSLEGTLAELGPETDSEIERDAREAIDRIKRFSPGGKTTVLYLSDEHRLLVCMENIMDKKFPTDHRVNKKRFRAEMLAGYTYFLMEQLRMNRGYSRKRRPWGGKKGKAVSQAIASYVQMKLYMDDPDLKGWLRQRTEYFFFPGWGYAGGKIIYDYQKARGRYDDQVLKLVLSNYCESAKKAYYFITAMDQLKWF